MKGKVQEREFSGLSTGKHGTCASVTVIRSSGSLGCVCYKLTVQVFSPEWIYVDEFSRTGLKGNEPAVPLEMLHPVKKYCLLTDDSL